MDPRLLRLLELVSLAMLAWIAFRLVGRLHAILAMLLVLLAICNVIVAYLIRYQPAMLAAVYHKPIVKQYLRGVAWCTGDQLQMSAFTNKAVHELLLRTERDFTIAAYRAKSIVRGHDQTIDAALSRIQEAVTLRAQQPKGGAQLPLASFLLVGSEGVGKRYLVRVLAKLLYRSANVLAFECERVKPELLLGSKHQPGELFEPVRRQPCQAILFEGIEGSSSDLIRLLSTILTRGSHPAPDGKQPVSFANTTFFLTTTKGTSTLERLANQTLTDTLWHHQAVDALVSETLIDQVLLNAVSDVLLFHRPNDLVKAEVVALLMKKEASAHGISLSWIDPEILAAQVLQIGDGSGFSLVPERIRRLLRKPLVAATQNNRQSLSLRVRSRALAAGG